VKGYIEPLPADHPTKLEFENKIIGTVIPSEYIPAIEKGFREYCEKSQLTGHAIEGIRFVLEDGKAHMVDSNEIAFRLAAAGAIRQAYDKAGPQVRTSVCCSVCFLDLRDNQHQIVINNFWCRCWSP
jgi:elongation factor G